MSTRSRRHSQQHIACLHEPLYATKGAGPQERLSYSAILVHRIAPMSSSRLLRLEPKSRASLSCKVRKVSRADARRGLNFLNFRPLSA
jgi:hypothetical protein